MGLGGGGGYFNTMIQNIKQHNVSDDENNETYPWLKYFRYYPPFVNYCVPPHPPPHYSVSYMTDVDLLVLICYTYDHFEIRSLLNALMTNLVGNYNVPAKILLLHWINMIPKNRKGDMGGFIPKILTTFLQTLFHMISNDIIALFASDRILGNLSVTHCEKSYSLVNTKRPEERGEHW